MLQTNLYINYAMERIKVLDEAFDKATSEFVSDKDKAPFMKIFLDETRKPEQAKGLEFNLNLNNNEVNVINVEDRLGQIADQMRNLPASAVIDMVHREKKNDDD